MIMFHAFIACFCSKKNKFLFGFSGSIDLFPHPQRRFGDWLPTKNTGLSNLHGGRCKRHIPPKTEIGRTLREMESVSSQRKTSHLMTRASTLHCRYNTEQPTALAPILQTTKLKLDEKNKNRKKSRLLFLILSIFENIFMTSLDEPMFIFI
jgi:hypothetical protein